MKIRFSFVPFLAAAAFLLAAVFAFPALAEDVDFDAFDALFSDWSQPTTPGCALAVVRDGKTLLLRGYGVADLESGQAITPDTVFRLGTASKLFTGAAVEVAAEQGKIDLEKDVRRIVPELPEYQAPITARLLLDQASGLPDYREVITASGRSGPPLTGERILMALAKERFPRFAPGTKHEESASNEFVLALLLERVTGQSLRDYAAQQLFRPLGMSQTAYHDPYRVGGENHAQSYVQDADGNYQAVDGGREIPGPGGVESSAADLARWMMSRPSTAAAEHEGSWAGSWAGFRAAIVRRPGGGVACLCNLAGIDALELAHEAADLALAPAP